MKPKFLIIACAAMLLNTTAQAYIWTSAIPTQVQLVDGGLLVLGAFDNSAVSCASGPSGIFVPSTDPRLKEKLSVALLAIATEKRIEALIADPVATNCVAVSAIGSVPVAWHNYWTLK